MTDIRLTIERESTDDGPEWRLILEEGAEDGGAYMQMHLCEHSLSAVVTDASRNLREHSPLFPKSSKAILALLEAAVLKGETNQ